MIARNYRRYPEALELQLVLPLHCVVVRRVRERHSGGGRRTVALLADRDTEDFPIGSIVRTPLGELAKVVGHRGGRRKGGGVKDCHERLVCRYLNPTNKRQGVVQLLPKLVTLVQEEEAQRA